MGRDAFTHASSLRVHKKHITNILNCFNFPSEGETASAEELKDCLADNLWQYVDAKGDTFFFECSDESDEDFDWDIFESISEYLECGSFYEEDGGDTIYAGYVEKECFTRSSFLVDPEEVDNRDRWSLIETEIVTFDRSILSVNKPRATDFQIDSEEPNSSSLREIDTSFWLTKDKIWMAERRANWVNLESMLGEYKSKKGLSVLKQYYLKGKMPNWESFKEWNSYNRHLDICSLIWMHPSWDKNVLSNLRNDYLNSKLIVLNDVKCGFEMFFGDMELATYMSYSSEEEMIWPNSEGHNEEIFDVLIGDFSTTEYTIYCGNPTSAFRQIPHPVYSLPKGRLITLQSMAKLLNIENMYPVNEDFIYQYDAPLEWWYRGASVDFENFKIGMRNPLRVLMDPLRTINSFDVDREGDTCRSRFVTKIRDILDNREFQGGVNEAWKDVKAGR